MELYNNAETWNLQRTNRVEVPGLQLPGQLSPQGAGVFGIIAEARKLEHSCPRTLKVKYKGS